MTYNCTKWKCSISNSTGHACKHNRIPNERIIKSYSNVPAKLLDFQGYINRWSNPIGEEKNRHSLMCMNKGMNHRRLRHLHFWEVHSQLNGVDDCPRFCQDDEKGGNFTTLLQENFAPLIESLVYSISQ